MSRIGRATLMAGIATTLALAATTAKADHWWGGFYWSHSQTPADLVIVDNVTRQWDAVLDMSIDDWQQSEVLNLTKIGGNGSRRNCTADDGTIKVCNDSYGYTGWLGVAHIWHRGGVIQRAVTKLNDSYFDSPDYNTPEWRVFVSCQEIGHAFGLGHQDENHANANLNSCMDYTRYPASNQHPNAHDYEQLATIYLSTIDPSADSGDGSDTGGSGRGKGRNKATGGGRDLGHLPQGWGRAIRLGHDGKPDLYELRLSNGEQVITHVFNVPGEGDHDH